MNEALRTTALRLFPRVLSVGFLALSFRGLR